MIFKRGDGYVNSNGDPVTSDGKLLSESDLTDVNAQLVQVTEQRDTLLAQAQASSTEAQGRIDTLTTERNTLQGTLTETSRERDDLKKQVGDLTTERDAGKADLERKTAEWETQRAALLQDTADSLKREDDLKAKVADLQAQVDAEPNPDTSSQTDPTTGQKTGELPFNVVGAGKLKAIGVTTWELLRTATDQQLTDAGLDGDQIAKLRTSAS